MESNYNFGLLCNSVFCKSEEFFKIRRDILRRSGFKIKLVVNSDINFTNIFGRNFSNCWLFFDVLKESDSLLSRVNYLINYLKKNNAEKKAEVQLSPSNEAKESILSYKLIDQNDFGYLLEVKPKSGRFHQIRVQLAYVGSPILGDVKYGADDEYKRLSICLHAWKISFPTSLGDSKIMYSAPLPQDKFWKFKSL